MAFRIIWLAGAKRDLRELLTYIATDNPKAARDYVREIRAAASRLMDFPDSGRIFDDRYRVIVQRNHLIFYSRSDDGRVRIARVIDGRRDIETLLGPD